MHISKYDPINSALFVKNRKRLLAEIANTPKALVIVNSNYIAPRSADSVHEWRQNPDAFYLTGLDQEQTTLILCPEHPNEKMRELVFIRKTNEKIAVWEGHKYTKQEAQEISGINTVYWADQLPDILPALIHFAQNIYLNANEHGRAHTSVPDADLLFARKMLQQYPLHNYKRLAPIMHKLRAIKQPTEIEILKTACNITHKAFNRILKFVQPGRNEYEVEAEILHEFLMNKASGAAYDSIVAGGKNAIVLHYVQNNQVLNDGDVLLLDFGANYANYSADLSRSIPVNGKYTKRQKEVYNAVLHVFKEARKMLVPGTMFTDYNKQVGKLMEEQLIKLGLLDAAEVAKQNENAPLYKKYFMHGTSHFLGIDTHDVGFNYLPMQAGMVFTCEPGIYIPEENLGIRIENDILVTENEPIDLMADIPIEADHIEQIMQDR